MKPTKLFIPLICYNHTCNTEWMMSILKLLNEVRNRGINCTFYPIFFDSLVSRARNAAVAHFMQDKEATHLMFIDSDIIFEPDDVFKLLESDQPIISGMYPKKYITWDRVKQDPNLEHVDFPIGNSVMLNEDNLIESNYLPTGFLMIKKFVIKAIMSEHPELSYKNDIDGYGYGDFFYNLFRVGVNENSIYESEDWGFCSLWKESGGKILIHPEVNVKHMGWHEYSGNLLKYIIENKK